MHQLALEIVHLEEDIARDMYHTKELERIRANDYRLVEAREALICAQECTVKELELTLQAIQQQHSLAQRDEDDTVSALKVSPMGLVILSRS